MTNNDKIYATNLRIDVSYCLSPDKLATKLCIGPLLETDLAGWSWFVIETYSIIVFVHVEHATFHNKFTIETDTI